MDTRKADFDVTAFKIVPQLRVRLGNDWPLAGRSEISEAREVAHVEIDDEGPFGHERPGTLSFVGTSQTRRKEKVARGFLAPGPQAWEEEG
jgi:hypothetical protein